MSVDEPWEVLVRSHGTGERIEPADQFLDLREGEFESTGEVSCAGQTRVETLFTSAKRTAERRRLEKTGDVPDSVGRTEVTIARRDRSAAVPGLPIVRWRHGYNREEIGDRNGAAGLPPLLHQAQPGNAAETKPPSSLLEWGLDEPALLHLNQPDQFQRKLVKEVTQALEATELCARARFWRVTEG
jgi:hypothetical protein